MIRTNGVVVVSPHLDDAVLSVGGWMLANPGCALVTVCAGVPGPLPLTHYDAQCGFVRGDQAVQGRRREDLRAAAVVDAVATHMQFLDCQYGGDFDDQAVRRPLARAMVGAHTVLVPLGMLHRDHIDVARVGAAAAVLAKVPKVLAYEELPYRVVEPEETARAMQRCAERGWEVGDVQVWDGRPRARKAAAVACYSSQLAGLDTEACMVPERLHQLTPPPG